MVLIICDECGKRHSEYAKACPECGKPKINGILKAIAVLPGKARCLYSYFTENKQAKVFGVLGAAALFAFFPRFLFLLSATSFDPFRHSNTKTEVAWIFDGGYEYTGGMCNSWNVCLFDNSESVERQCNEKGSSNYFAGWRRSGAPNFSSWLPANMKILDAVPAERNVSGGTCKGTIYRVSIASTETSYQRFYDYYCRSFLVKPFNFEPWKRKAWKGSKLYDNRYLLTEWWLPEQCFVGNGDPMD